MIGICGSHREESTSRAALVHALAAAEAEGAETELLDEETAGAECVADD